MNLPVTNVTARYWLSDQAQQPDFPEQKPGSGIWADLQKKRSLGLCFSGGGTRAATAATGQLRALKDLGILKDVRYCAAVSGGSWAATPYCFVPASNDDALLGAMVDPEELVTSAHLVPEAGSLCEAMTHAYLTTKAFAHLFGSNRGSESYSSTISDVFLKPFGLDRNGEWFTWDEEDAQRILSLNPGLEESGMARYHTVPKGKPMLIAGGTIRHYGSALAPSHPLKRVPFEMTPLYCGVGPFNKPSRFYNHPVGGGFVESFAYDSKEPRKVGEGHASAELYRRLGFRGSPVLTLGDVAGVSGAAPGEFNFLVETLGFPKFQHWSPQGLDERGKLRSQRLSHQDGGLSENLGLLSLLARKTEVIFAFVNSEDPVVVGDSAVFPDYVEEYFREPTEDYSRNRYEDTQVFDPSGRKDLVKQVRTSVLGGGPAVAFTELQVKSQPRFGIRPYRAKICWFFLEARVNKAGQTTRSSGNWMKKLPEGSPAAKLFASDPGNLKNFPCFRTFFENRDSTLWDIIRLDDQQATLLAHYSSWMVGAEGQKVKRWAHAAGNQF